MTTLTHETMQDTSLEIVPGSAAQHSMGQHVVETVTDESPIDRIERHVNRSLNLVLDHFEPDEHGNALYELTHCARDASLTDYVRSHRLDDLVKKVPAVGELIKEMDERAHRLLDTTTDEPPSRTEVESLGFAADIIGDTALLEQALHSLDDTLDEKYEPFRLAIKKALSEHVLFIDAKRTVDKELLDREASRIVLPRKLPDRDVDSANPYLSTWEVRSHDLPGHTTGPAGVKMQSHDNLFAEQRRSDEVVLSYDPDRHLTHEEQYRLQGQLAIDEFIRQSRQSRN